jgi:ribosome biogenesis GTPase A
MKTIKHKLQLPIINLDKIVCTKDSKQQQRRHSQLLPNTIRCLICGPSNCGKSNVMLSLVFNKNGLKFENIYIYSKSLYQPKYNIYGKY